MSYLYVRACNAALCAAILFFAANFSLAGWMHVGPAVPLTDLLAPNASILVGDKLFEDMTYVPTGNMPAASGVQVVPIEDDFGNFGIQFIGAFMDLFSTPGGSAADIMYRVTATDPAFLISDAHVVSDVAVSGAGLAAVLETFLTEFEQEDLIVLDTPGSTIRTAEVIFDIPVRTLSVQKNILMLAEAPGSAAMASFVNQTFSQVPDPTQEEIPEPATLGLAGLASLFLGAMYMRRRLG